MPLACPDHTLARAFPFNRTLPQVNPGEFSAAGPSSCAREGSFCLLSRADCVSLSSGKHVPSRNYKYKSLVKGKSLKEKRG